MKKLIGLLALLCLFVCLCGCGKQQATGAVLLQQMRGEAASSAPAPESVAETAQPESAAPTRAPVAAPTPVGESTAAKTPAPTAAPTPAATATPVETPSTADLPATAALLVTGATLLIAAFWVQRRKI